jgi:hypothetical protein
LDPGQFFPSLFDSLKNEGRRTLSYLSRNSCTLLVYFTLLNLLFNFYLYISRCASRGLCVGFRCTILIYFILYLFYSLFLYSSAGVPVCWIRRRAALIFFKFICHHLSNNYFYICIGTCSTGTVCWTRK